MKIVKEIKYDSEIIHAKQRIGDTEDPIILRYMSVEKFIFILMTQKIYFPLLNELEDSFEGDLELAKKVCAAVRNSFKLCPIETRKRFRVLSFVGSGNECDLMWRAYCPNGGVAIKTTLDKFKTSLSSSTKEAVAVNVLYKEDEGYPYLHPIAFKQAFYKSENELRIVQGIEGTHIKNSLVESKNSWAMNSHFIEIDDFKFIDEIILSPRRSDHVLDLCREPLKIKGLEDKIRESQIKISR